MKWFLLILCFFTTLFSTRAYTQSRSIIFDDFDYQSTTNLFGSNLWRTNTNNTSPTSIATVGWYNYGWDREISNRPTGRFETNGSFIELILPQDHLSKYNANDVNTLPTHLVSGFVASSGTWVARVKLADLETLLGKGYKSTYENQNSFANQAFWVTSDYVVSKSQSRTDSHWSEINFEWQNFFGETVKDWITPFGGKIKAPAMYMANGATFDGEMANSAGISGNFSMYDPIHPKFPTTNPFPFSCYFLNGENSNSQWFEHFPTYHWFYGTNQESIINCRDAIYRDLNITSKSDQWVELMIQFADNDPSQLKLAIVSRAFSGTKRLMYMEGKYTIYDRSQNMRSFLSISQPWNENISKTQVPTTAKLKMGVDWFYYTPDTNVDIWGVLRDVDTIRNNGISRLNSTGISLTPIPPNNSNTVRNSQFYLLPPNQARNFWKLRLPNNVTNNYKVQWRYRSIYPWGVQPWSDWTLGSLNYNFCTQISLCQVEVRYNIDIHNDGNVDLDWSNDISRCFNSSTVGNLCSTEFLSIRPNLQPKESTLHGAFPNPFNPSTNISYEITKTQHVKLRVLNILGKEVVTLVDEVQSPGQHSAFWDASKLPSGVYFAQLMVGDTYVKTKPLTLTK